MAFHVQPDLAPNGLKNKELATPKFAFGIKKCAFIPNKTIKSFKKFHLS